MEGKKQRREKKGTKGEKVGGGLKWVDSGWIHKQQPAVEPRVYMCVVREGG